MNSAFFSLAAGKFGRRWAQLKHIVDAASQVDLRERSWCIDVRRDCALSFGYAKNPGYGSQPAYWTTS